MQSLLFFLFDVQVIPSLASGSPFILFPVFFSSNSESLIVFFFFLFLVLAERDISGSFSIFLAPDLELAISPRSLGSFQWDE